MIANCKLVVFDLDYTLWDCGGTWVDCTNPPFTRTTDGRVVDRSKRHLRLYDDVLDILDACDQSGLPMALASRTSAPEWARELMGLLGILERFEVQEIYPGSKVRHFAAIQTETGIAYSDMVFLDDEMRNIHEVGALGVRTIHVPHGLTWDLVQHA